jgi:hypothetical protein
MVLYLNKFNLNLELFSRALVSTVKKVILEDIIIYTCHCVKQNWLVGSDKEGIMKKRYYDPSQF